MRRVLIAMLAVSLATGLAAAQDMGILVRPQSSGSRAFLTGNEFILENQWFQLGYVQGAFDMLSAIAHEASSIAASPTAPVPWYTQAEWDVIPDSELPAVAAAITIFRAGLAVVFVPSGVTTGQMLSVVENYISTHPTERHNSAALLIWRALAEARWE